MVCSREEVVVALDRRTQPRIREFRRLVACAGLIRPDHAIPCDHDNGSTPRGASRAPRRLPALRIARGYPANPVAGDLTARDDRGAGAGQGRGGGRRAVRRPRRENALSVAGSGGHRRSLSAPAHLYICRDAVLSGRQRKRPWRPGSVSRRAAGLRRMAGERARHHQTKGHHSRRASGVGALSSPAPLDEIIGRHHVATEVKGRPMLIPLPHPSGASSWIHQGNHPRLLRQAIALIEEHVAPLILGRRAAKAAS